MENENGNTNNDKKHKRKKRKNFLSNAKKYAKKGQMGRGTKMPEELYQYFVGILEAVKEGVEGDESKRGADMRDSLRRLAASDDGCGATVASRRMGAGKTRRVRVELMDGSQLDLDIDRKSRGGDLLDSVCDALDLLEKDYFGLLHAVRGDPRVWIDLGKRLSKTFKNEPWEVQLAVKFYPSEPSELREDLTRYHLHLAIRRDLMQGRLTCSPITYALLGSYILQAELGDYEDTAIHGGVLAERRVAPPNALTPELEEKIIDLYKSHGGLSPAEAELHYLENAKKLPMYGAELHCVRDSEEIDLLLGVCCGGVTVSRNGLTMSRFPWAKITRISYNKRIFTLRLRASEFDEFETLLSFKLPSTRASKKLWKCSVEQHMFFRRAAPVVVDRVSGFPRLGSRRLSCRKTLQQIRAELAQRQPPDFQRTVVAN